MMCLQVVLAVFITLCISCFPSEGNGFIDDNVVVETLNGPVRGSNRISRAGKLFHRFLGIPYAQPPVGNLRFEPPQKPNNWIGIKETTSYREPCLQYELMFLGRIKGIEDCLYLNIFTPNLPNLQPVSESERIPVMVFIHGGGFMSGRSNNYGGKYIVDENVMLVTVAYRVASFGFLSTGDGLIRGNMGLRDQNMALKWVQENIDKFGGDKNRVTLFGESSGASAVHWHLLSPKSKGLFQRAISQTGSALRRYPNTNDLAGQAQSLASRVGCPTEMAQAMVDCLKSVDAMKIVQTHRDPVGILRGDFAIYGPTVEAVKDENAFITEEPEAILESGNYAQVPWISGINSADGILFATAFVKDREMAREIDSDDGWTTNLPRLLRFDNNDPQTTAIVAQRIRDFYFGNGSLLHPNNFQGLVNMYSDRMYFLPSYNAVNLQSQTSPVYLYYFDYKTALSTFKIADAVEPELRLVPRELQIAGYFVRSWVDENILLRERPFYGAAHADELFLLFNTNPVFEARRGTPDYEASKAMVKIWIDYAKNNSTDQVTFDGIAWPQVSNGNSLQYLRIGQNRKVIDDPIEVRMRFWKSLNLTFLGRQL